MPRKCLYRGVIAAWFWLVLLVTVAPACSPSDSYGVAPCSEDADCAKPLVCLVDSGVCVQCTQDDHCPLSGKCDEQRHVCEALQPQCEVDLDCVPPSGCQVGVCGEGKCQFQVANEGLPCNDGVECTEQDVCKEGVCAGTYILECGTQPCYKQEDGAECDDGDPCTHDDVCSAGECLGELTVGCVDPDQDEDGVSVGEGDCDDNNPLVYPSAPELCDLLDNNCDGQEDESCSGGPCIATGCHSEVCASSEVETECGEKPEFDCLVFTFCGPNGADGGCAWKVTPEFEACLADICIPTDEICDGVDNNCDDAVDEGCGAACGGSTGDGCAANEFCQYPPNTCFEAGLQGTCTAMPVTCPTLDAPVCGCDSVTYPNLCAMHAAAVSLWYEGACSLEVCKHVAKDGYGLCLNSLGYASDGNKCVVVMGCSCEENCQWIYSTKTKCEQMCGYVPAPCTTDANCPPGLTCQNACADGGCQGQCLPQDESDKDGDGVAQSQGDCNDTISTVYPAAVELCDSLDNDCDGEVDEQCDSIACGGTIGKNCGTGKYCRFDVGVCNSENPSGVCTPAPEECHDVYYPVCGCNMVTYTSDCAAAAKKVTVLKLGPCMNSPQCKDLSGVSLGDCGNDMGYGFINGQCQKVTGCGCGIHCDKLYSNFSACSQACD